MLCPIKVNSNTIELTVHTSYYCVLNLLCVTFLINIQVCLNKFQFVNICFSSKLLYQTWLWIEIYSRALLNNGNAILYEKEVSLSLFLSLSLSLSLFSFFLFVFLLLYVTQYLMFQISGLTNCIILFALFISLRLYILGCRKLIFMV